MPQSPIFNQITLFFREYLPHKPLSVCVAVSGGADSVALFRLLFLLKNELCINRLGIAHINHKLRGKESDGDAEFVESIAKSAGVPFFLKNFCMSLNETRLRKITFFYQKQPLFRLF